MRLIDADELKTAFPCGEYVRTESVRSTIDNMPTIEMPDMDALKSKIVKRLGIRDSKYLLPSEKAIWDVINDAPTIEERKTGKWIGWLEPGNENYHCSACGTAWYPEDLYLGGNDYPKYCPECGAQMENWRSDTEEGAQE